MAGNRIMRGAAARRRLLPAILGALALAAILAACGGGETSGPDTAALEREADAELLNEVLGRQLAAVEASEAASAGLTGWPRRMAATFRQQEQEHAVAVVAVLRDLDAAEEPVETEIDAGSLGRERDRLRFLAEMEAATIQLQLSAIGRLHSGAARHLLAASVANQAQRLVLLRRALGEPPPRWIADAFETGEAPVP